MSEQEHKDKEQLITNTLNEMLDKWSIPPLRVMASDRNIYEQSTEIAYEARARGDCVLVLRVPDLKVEDAVWLEDYIGMAVTANLKRIVDAFGGVT